MKKFLIFFAVPFLLLTGCQKESDIGTVFQEGEPEKAPLTNFDQNAMPAKGEQVVRMETSMGVIYIKLFPEMAPKTVENFVGLVEKGYYDGILFHRVIPDFMVQGGDPTGTGMGGESLWGGKFEDEFHPSLKNIRGALSMANSGPNTNGSQFFIVQAPATPWLDGRHSVFGQVVEGMEVVDKIVGVPRDARDKPLEDVKMEKVTLSTFE